MIPIILGALVIVWAIWARGGGNPANSAEIFRGPIGGMLNLVAIIIGIVLIVVGIF